MFREIARISIISRSHIFPSKALDIFLISGFIALDFFVVNRLPLTWPICFCLAGGRNWLSRWTILIPSEIRWCRSVTSFSDCWNAMRIFSRVSSSWNTVMASNTDWIRLSIDFLPVWAISYFRFFYLCNILRYFLSAGPISGWEWILWHSRIFFPCCTSSIYIKSDYSYIWYWFYTILRGKSIKFWYYLTWC